MGHRDSGLRARVCAARPAQRRRRAALQPRLGRYAATHAGTVRADADRVIRGRVSVSWAADDGKTIRLIEGGHLTKTSTGYEIHRVIEAATAKAASRSSGRLTAACSAACSSVVSATAAAIWPRFGGRSMRRPGHLSAQTTSRQPIASSIGSRLKTRSSPCLQTPPLAPAGRHKRTRWRRTTPPPKTLRQRTPKT